MPKFKIPDRWEAYSTVGRLIEGTKFIAFKVPLKFHRGWNLEELKRSVPDLKSIIDLTNTNKYYGKSQCEELGFNYKKIFVPGQIVPPKRAVDEFFSAVSEVLSHEGLIGVHCTHGLNRTGYMICRYMIEKNGVDPEEAILRFNTARGHDQEREHYIEHLKNKSWENEETTVDTHGNEGGQTKHNETSGQKTEQRSDSDMDWRRKDKDRRDYRDRGYEDRRDYSDRRGYYNDRREYGDKRDHYDRRREHGDRRDYNDRRELDDRGRREYWSDSNWRGNRFDDNWRSRNSYDNWNSYGPSSYGYDHGNSGYKRGYNHHYNHSSHNQHSLRNNPYSRNIDQNNSNEPNSSESLPSSQEVSSSTTKTTQAAADTTLVTSSDVDKKHKENFLMEMSKVVVKILDPYRKAGVKGHISNKEDFKHLAKKITYTIMQKELKVCKSTAELKVNEKVKKKSSDYVSQYMKKYDGEYKRSPSPYSRDQNDEPKSSESLPSSKDQNSS